MQKQQRFVADQRFDLPHYESMMSLIAAEFHDYNSKFITPTNKIVRNWELTDNGGLQVKVDTNDDSVLFNSERPDYESLAVRLQSCADLTLDLEDNSTNYVEVELYTTTTGEDSVAIWDSTANSGVGEEFIQNVDTVRNNVSHRLVSNTISFSVSRPDRIPLATVTTSGGGISNISDQRDFLFHLDSDWDFDGTAFGVTRTDKTISSIKNDSDALKTVIREMKGLTAWTVDDEWYQPMGVGAMGILERINYILVDGGNISWNLPKPSTGSFVAVKSDPVVGIADDDTFTLDDGIAPVTFTFDTNGSAPPNAVTVPLEGTAAQVQTAIIAAINLSAINITAAPGTETRVELTNDNPGAGGNIAITESISNGSSLSPLGMIEGFDNNELKWTGDLRIIAPGRAFDYTIAAQTVGSLLDGEVVFVTLPVEGVAPGGPLTVSKVASSAYLLNPSNTRNYIIAYRSASKIYFGNGWQSVELEDGETTQLGDGITSEWLTATGLVDEWDSTPPYFSNHWVTPGASFTQGISEIDTVVESIYNMVVGPAYDESLISDGGAGFQVGSKVTLPPPFGLGSNMTYQTDMRQLEVFIDGRKAKLGVSADWIEVANLGAGIGDQIELRRAVNEDSRIDFRVQTGGGQDGTVGTDAPDIYDEGILVTSQVARMNFRGPGIRAESPGPGDVDIIVEYPRELAKLIKNETGSTIVAGKVVAWLDGGTMGLADANVVSLSDIIGVTAEDVDDGEFGIVVRAGNVVAALSALGATQGDAVYLSGTPGLMTLTPPTGLTDTLIRMGRAEPQDGVSGTTAIDLWLHPEIIAEP
jgi:hypothetical protein